MIAFAAVAALIALACAGFVGWDALKRPRPELVVWTLAFLVFAVAAASEVIGATLGWSSGLARVYYLTGAVLVVGILALGELYLLRPGRMPAITPGISLLVAAIATTAVWSAPVDPARLQEVGWHAIERGPFLVALAVGINAGGTLVLVGGALHSAMSSRAGGRSERRAAGCALIALGALVVAVGGTLTRFGRPEYLYIAMSVGIGIIFSGIVLTRGLERRSRSLSLGPGIQKRDDPELQRTGWSSVASHVWPLEAFPARSEGIAFVVENVLPLPSGDVAEVCRRWGANSPMGDILTREQARATWALRVALPIAARAPFDELPVTIQAQIAELFQEVWSGASARREEERLVGPQRTLAILHPTVEETGEVR